MSEAARRPGSSPSTSGPLVALTDQCVQCGLCLPACPSYAFDPIESESPRGRIALVRAWELDLLLPTPIGDAHLDHCLGCRRCEVVCPAGVKYGPLLIQARAHQRERRRPGWHQQAIEWLALRPAFLGRLLAMYGRLYPLLPWRPLPRPPAPQYPLEPAIGDGAVAVFLGCVARPYETGLRNALRRLCAAVGISVAMPEAQTCCGSVHAHAGALDQVAVLAARNRAAFAGADTVLTLASGCREQVAEGLRGAANVVDAIDFIADRAAHLRFRRLNETIALHLPCTQRNVVGSEPTRALLACVPGVEVVLLDAGFGCCGAAGTQMLTEPARAAAYRQPLLNQLAASGATRLLSANIGCRLHFANGTRVRVQHPLEFLGECLQ